MVVGDIMGLEGGQAGRAASVPYLEALVHRGRGEAAVPQHQQRVHIRGVRLQGPGQRVVRLARVPALDHLVARPGHTHTHTYISRSLHREVPLRRERGGAPGVELGAVRAERRAEDVHAVSRERLQAAQGAQVPGKTARQGGELRATKDTHIHHTPLLFRDLPLLPSFHR